MILSPPSMVEKPIRKPTADFDAPAPPEKSEVRPSRVGTVFVGGHFDPVVARSMRMLAASQDTTVRALVAKALNDLLEAHGYGRPASEEKVPRGAAARRRERKR